MKLAFVDTSAFYAFLDGTDRFHEKAKDLMFSAEKEKWHLFTTSFVLHETWALTQARLGWEAVEDWLGSFYSFYSFYLIFFLLLLLCK